jgi:FAD/FMN-containing dehydrogenase
MSRHASWGNYPTAARQRVLGVHWRDDDLPVPSDGSTLLPRGLGRSYGDSCLNDGGTLLDTTRLCHLIEFDRTAGLLRCEGGVSLGDILEITVPHGWFLPVTPGTKQVTVAGAVANDVHGKNHHGSGTFGRFVTRFELVRSDGQRLLCSAHENEDLFGATIGGLGLTGLMTWVELRLKRVESALIDVESVRFDNLDAFFELTSDSDARFEYTVAWVDCLARDHDLGRGIFIRGNHAAASDGPAPSARRSRLSVPCFAPGFLLNRWTLRAFNSLYYARHRERIVRRTTHHESFFYPLDSVRDWNRLYGRRGLLQYQCLVPHDGGREAVRAMFSRISASGEGSFLAVLKVFGDQPSPGLLSFPRPGITLALDFPNRGHRTLDLLDELDSLVRRHGGRVYPAKDARMSPQSFQAYFPEWREFSRFVDPAFSSGFWRRVTVPPPGEVR